MKSTGTDRKNAGPSGGHHGVYLSGLFLLKHAAGPAMAGTLPPVTMAVLRWGLVALLLGIALWPQIRTHLPALRAEAGQIIWLGGLGMGLCGRRFI